MGKLARPMCIARADTGNPQWTNGNLQSRWINMDPDEVAYDPDRHDSMYGVRVVTMYGTRVPLIGIEMLFPSSVDANTASAISLYIISAINEKYNREQI